MIGSPARPLADPSTGDRLVTIDRCDELAGDENDAIEEHAAIVAPQAAGIGTSRRSSAVGEERRGGVIRQVAKVELRHGSGCSEAR